MDPYAQALFDATNRRRASVGVAPLRANGYLNAIARMRSQEMSDYDYFSHTSPVTGENVFDLMERFGVPFGYAGENLALNNYSESETVAVADQALWDSPSHHENIVNPYYTQVGIALGVVLILVTVGLARGMLRSSGEREGNLRAEIVFLPPGGLGAGVTTLAFSLAPALLFLRRQVTT